MMATDQDSKFKAELMIYAIGVMDQLKLLSN